MSHVGFDYYDRIWQFPIPNVNQAFSTVYSQIFDILVIKSSSMF